MINKTAYKTLTLEQENEFLKQRVEELQAKLNHCEELFRLNQHQKYDASREQTDSDQISLFNEAEKESAKKSKEPDVEVIVSTRKRGRSKSRKTNDELPIEKVRYELSKEKQVCPTCDRTQHEMKTEIRKELKIILAQVKVVHHIRQVHACRDCNKVDVEGTILTAPAQKPIMPGSMVSPSLLAFIMERKYNQRLPLYRQKKPLRILESISQGTSQSCVCFKNKFNVRFLKASLVKQSNTA